MTSRNDRFIYYLTPLRAVDSYLRHHDRHSTKLNYNYDISQCLAKIKCSLRSIGTCRQVMRFGDSVTVEFAHGYETKKINGYSLVIRGYTPKSKYF